MNSILITRPVIIKIRVTEKYKVSLLHQIEYSLRRLDLELQRLERQTSDGGGQPSPTEARGEAPPDTERRQRLAARQKLLEQARDIRMLQLGEEVAHGRVESLVELRVGDDWQSLMGVEVLVEDGKVVEIRSHSGGSPDG